MKVLITTMIDPKDVPAFALMAAQLPQRVMSYSSTLDPADKEAIAAALADHAEKLAQCGRGRAEER